MALLLARVKWLLEDDDRHRVTGWLFLKLLALIYLAAFFSLAVQVAGLVGENGILPLQPYLDRNFIEHGIAAWWRIPTLFWFASSNLALEAAAYAGCVLAVLLLLGRVQTPALILMFVLYLSLYHAGQIFLNFQWDYLLMEAGFIAIFLVNGPNRMVIFLFHWLLFRLRFLSGFSKLSSDDPAWSGMTAVRYYFETQPLPHAGAWYAHQLPDWLLRAGTGFTLCVELLVPFLIFLPRPFRLLAAVLTILIQLLIIATSNHNWINLLTIALCLFLLDDRIVGWLRPGLSRGAGAVRPRSSRRNPLLFLPVMLLLGTGLGGMYVMLTDRDHPDWLVAINAWGIGNNYHVFPTMQTERQEFTIQGSDDGQEWRAYRFKYKPDGPEDISGFIVPHQPRLDWMIWFVPTQHPMMQFWFDSFMWRLGRAEPDVLGLLEYSPFQERPPRYLRVLVYRYRFTDWNERSTSGHYWSTEYLGEFPDVRPRIP